MNAIAEDPHAPPAQLSFDMSAPLRLARFTGAAPVREYSAAWLELRKATGYRSIRSDVSRWKTHVLSSALADISIRDVSPGEARAWFAGVLVSSNATPHHRGEREPLGAQTLKNILNLVRCCFDAAVADGIILSNPFREVKVPKIRGASSRDPWTVLTLEEQRRLILAVPMPERWMVAFAIGCGVRQGELYALHLEDLHLDSAEPFAVVRFGGYDARGTLKPPKNGRVRTVPLFGAALFAAGHWAAELATYAPSNPHGLVFPKPSGKARREAKPPGAWRGWLDAAKIARRVRWHDLRHSCAASLVSGWWGRRWSLEEVCQLLGHSSIQVTERYAHFADNVLVNAANESDSSRRGPSVSKATRRNEEKSGSLKATGTEGGKDAMGWDDDQSRQSGLNRRPVLYESTALPLSYVGETTCEEKPQGTEEPRFTNPRREAAPWFSDLAGNVSLRGRP